MPPNTCPHCDSDNLEIVTPYPLRPSWGWLHHCCDWAYVTFTGALSEADARRNFAAWCSTARYAMEHPVQEDVQYA